MIKHIPARFQRELQRRFAAIQQQATGLRDLREQRQSLQAEQIAQIANLDARMETLKPVDLHPTLTRCQGM